MATKTFSGRAEEDMLAFADALVRKSYGVSFGQYCATTLLESVWRTGALPQQGDGREQARKREAAAFIKGFSARAIHPEVGKLSDDQLRDLIASRYE